MINVVHDVAGTSLCRFKEFCRIYLPGLLVVVAFFCAIIFVNDIKYTGYTVFSQHM
ncbi:MAG: hypothetical protein LBP35_07255 [Candidatus Ancillula trichonymphae]|nr:hypothetical protein [Candidatus Ancillula trichonymphae]